MSKVPQAVTWWRLILNLTHVQLDAMAAPVSLEVVMPVVRAPSSLTFEARL